MRIPKCIIEKALTDNIGSEYINISLDDVVNESQSDVLARLALIKAICESNLPDNEKLTEIYEQTKSRR